MRYTAGGQGWLVCPRLLELDGRHGEHPDRWPPCRWRSDHRCLIEHEHEEPLIDPEGHRMVLFVWQAGSDHADLHIAELTCLCGRRLVHADLIDPYTAPAADDPWAGWSDAELLAEWRRRRASE